MFRSICLDGNDKNETALRGLNSWVLNFIESNLELPRWNLVEIQFVFCLYLHSGFEFFN